MGSPSAQSNSLVGSLLGKDYKVLDQIGAGGMAVVYLVEHQTLLKRFAAKVLSPEHASNDEARARFTQEAHAASHLDHENIVTISDFGTTPDNRPFYVMELLRGQTLADRLEDGPMKIEDVVAVSVPVARALAHAHAEGVIHRDVKPENVFLVQRSQGRWAVKVLDFGIAKVTSNPALTKMGQALGSPMFMAPEACRGDDVDQRADLYSFGILLYVMLTGRVPFQDESLLKVLQMQVSSPVPPLRQFNAEVSPEIEAVVLRALAKNPDDRYPSMDALLMDLQAVLPEGSDSVLIQAQFGKSAHDTPFPGQSLRMMAVSSQRLMIGDQDAAKQLAATTPTTTPLPSASPSKRMPAAPAQGSKRGLFIGLAVVAVLAAGGAFAYTQMQGSGEGTARAAAPVAPIDQPIVANDPTPPRPRVVGPAVDPVVTDPVPVPVETVATGTPKVTETATAGAATVKVKPPVVTPPKTTKQTQQTQQTQRVPTVEMPTNGSATRSGSGSAVAPSGTGSAVKPPTVPAISVAPVVPKETPRVVPPGSGSATPPVVTPVITPKVTPPVVAAPVTGSMDATPTIASLDVNGPLPNSVVRRSVERALPALRTCYRTAAKAKGSTPPATVTLSFEVDESSAATNVSGSGAKDMGTLLGCAKGAIGRLQTQQAPDVGTVNVAVTISFRPL